VNVRAIAAIAVLLSVVFVSPARAAPHVKTYVLAIGYNGAPDPDDDLGLARLRYADDDAAAFAQLAQDLGGQAIVLSTFDADTAQRFPDLARRVRPPVLEELRRAVRELNASFEEDRRHGIDPQVLVSYSGHGVADEGQTPALMLSDGKLTQEVLYTDVLSALTASYVHLIVDACHAEAVVRPRDAQAAVIPLTTDDVQTALSKVTLRGLPRAGSIIAGSASTQTHEWDRWQQGVFTHEVISGLRGAADVNGDLRVEYSEMAAFLSAANREVRDSAARIKPLLGPPPAAPRTAIVDLGASEHGSFLLGRPGQFGELSISSDDGQRIADLRSEANLYVRLLVPSGRLLFVHTSTGEADLKLGAGERATFDSLKMHSRGFDARGALDVSLQRGLFATTFGPSYYRGFVDSGRELLAVPLAATENERVAASLLATQSDRRPPALAWTGLGVTAALLIASATFTVVALNAKSDFDAAGGLERESLAASNRFDTYRTLAIGTAITGVLAGGATCFLFLDK
jgi:hypothetical protein